MDDLSCGYRQSVPAQVDFHECDAGDLNPALFERPFHAVFHLAAYAAECMSPFCRRYNYSNNLLPQAGLLNRIISSQQDHGRFVLTSSVAVYGHATPPFDEQMTPHPDDPYGIAKLACEQDLRVAGDQHGVDWCVVRPRNVYGPGQSIWQRYRSVAGLWMRAALEGRPLQVFGDGLQQRSFTYCDDILEPLWNAAFSPDASCQTVNLGSGKTRTLLELVVALREATELDLRVEHLPARHEARRVWCDTRKSERLLKYEDQTELVPGLQRMWTWAKVAWEQHPGRRLPLAVPRPETVVGMPESWVRDFI